MTSTFSFGFGGDDIDIDIDETEVNDINETNTYQSLNAGDALPGLIAARKHDMAEWVSLVIWHTLSLIYSMGSRSGRVDDFWSLYSNDRSRVDPDMIHYIPYHIF